MVRSNIFFVRLYVGARWCSDYLGFWCFFRGARFGATCTTGRTLGFAFAFAFGFACAAALALSLASFLFLALSAAGSGALVIAPVSSTVAGGGFAGINRPLASLARFGGCSAAGGNPGSDLLPVILLLTGCASAAAAAAGCGTSVAAAAAGCGTSAAAAAAAALLGCDVLALILLFGWAD